MGSGVRVNMKPGQHPASRCRDEHSPYVGGSAEEWQRQWAGQRYGDWQPSTHTIQGQKCPGYKTGGMAQQPCLGCDQVLVWPLRGLIQQCCGV